MARVSELDVDLGYRGIEDGIPEGRRLVHWLGLVVVGLLLFVSRLFLALLFFTFLRHLSSECFEKEMN